MGSFDVETRWSNEWSISAHMFDLCARESIVQVGICGDGAGKMVATRDRDRAHGPGLFDDKVSMTCQVLELKEEDGMYRSPASFLCPVRTTHHFIEQISDTRTIWSHDALDCRVPYGAHTNACTIILR